MIFNICPRALKYTVTLNGAPGETISYTGTASGSVVLDAHGAGTIADVKRGTYSFTGSVSSYTKSSVSITGNATVNVYPDGAIFWFGNGDTSGDSLYGVCGGVSNATAWNATNFTTYILSGSNTLYNKTATLGNAVAIPAGKKLKFFWNSPYYYNELWNGSKWLYQRAYGVAGISGGGSVSPTADGTRISEIAVSTAITAHLYMSAYAQGGMGNTECTCTMYAIWLE